ncbi:MAG: hypothetical protein K8R48_01255 [Alphaproteobacteria bacterium]|nr:hypothetical protein [Alphaproteobacteria bacterium]
MDSRSLEIEYQKDGTAFKVVLTAKSPEIFAKASQQENIRDKKDEELIAALIAYIRSKDVLLVERYRDGLRHDGANGEPAMQVFSDSGKIITAKHFQDGRLNDGVNGEPAMQMFDDRNRLIHAVSYKNGERVKELSGQERDDYMYRLAQKNAGKPQPEGKKPGPGGAKIG